LYYYECDPEDDIINDETCRENDELKLISRTCVVIDCTVTINNAMEYSSAQLNAKTEISDLLFGSLSFIMLVDF
jgi:hypothetical protein